MLLRLGVICVALGVSLGASARDAFKVFGKATSLETVRKQEQAAFYELDQKRYDLVRDAAIEAYFEAHWKKEAEKAGTTPAQAEKAYFDKYAKVDPALVKKTLEQYKDEPQLAALPKEQQEKEVSGYLKSLEVRRLKEEMIRDAEKKGLLVVALEEPQEPVYQVSLTKRDRVRYGPKVTDVDPKICGTSGCDVEIIEYSEFQCPFCAKIIPTSERVLEKYKGKVAWAVRDFPLNFHPKARPAAIAAQCANLQGTDKYWSYYDILFENQRKLDASDLLKYGKEIGLNMSKFQTCIDKPAAAEEIVDENYKTGLQLGVTGTPAFFINGRKISGALPYSEFEKMIEQELAKAKS